VATGWGGLGSGSRLRYRAIQVHFYLDSPINCTLLASEAAATERRGGRGEMRL
jgi:hypothetical protein